MAGPDFRRLRREGSAHVAVEVRLLGVAHSEHRFPAPSSEPALPYLVAPLKGHSLSPRSCPATRPSAPSESHTNMTVEAT